MNKLGQLPEGLAAAMAAIDSTSVCCSGSSSGSSTGDVWAPEPDPSPSGNADRG